MGGTLFHHSRGAAFVQKKGAHPLIKHPEFPTLGAEVSSSRGAAPKRIRRGGVSTKKLC